MDVRIISKKSKMQSILNTAKGIIKEELEKQGYRIVKIFLFGSRARGKGGKDSDWDFSVITEGDVSQEKKWEIIMRIKRRLAKKIPNDVFIRTEKEVESQKRDVGMITYYALKEGIEI